MKRDAAIVLHTWKDHIWSIGSKGEPPEAVSVPAVGGSCDQDAGVGDGGSADGGGNVGADGPPGYSKDAVGSKPAGVEDGLVAGTEQKLTQEASVPGSCLLLGHSSDAQLIITRGI